MRVRLFRFGDAGVTRFGEIVRLDQFPVTLIETPDGSVRPGDPTTGKPLCVLDEESGNLVLVDHDPLEPTFVNEDPLQCGGLSPGDILSLGMHRFMVSYERTTSHPLPSRRYDIQSPVGV